MDGWSKLAEDSHIGSINTTTSDQDGDGLSFSAEVTVRTDPNDADTDNDSDGFTSDVDCDDDNADINPDAFDDPRNEIDEDCSTTAASLDITVFALQNAGFETASGATTDWGGELPESWGVVGETYRVTQLDTDNIYGDGDPPTDSGSTFAAAEGSKYLKVWPNRGANIYGPESPVYQEFSADNTGGVSPAEKTFFMAAQGMVHNSSLLKGLTEGVVWIKCFNDSYELQGDAQSVPLDAAATVDVWTDQYAVVTCGPDATRVQAVMSLNTPLEDLDGDGTAEEQQTEGNIYYDDVVFGEYVP